MKEMREGLNKSAKTCWTWANCSVGARTICLGSGHNFFPFFPGSSELELSGLLFFLQVRHHFWGTSWRSGALGSYPRKGLNVAKKSVKDHAHECQQAGSMIYYFIIRQSTLVGSAPDQW